MSKSYEPRYSELFIIQKYIEEFGEEKTIGEVFAALTKYVPYKCPKCNGRGYVEVEYNGYPSGLPDSGFVYEAAFKDIECDLCEGRGYMEVKMKPKYVQNGWEEVKS